MPRKPRLPSPLALRRLAEARLRTPQVAASANIQAKRLEADTLRVVHELEVHRIELEMQNAELQHARDELEVTLEKYTDLYDFAPVGYFSLDDQGRILEANLTGATLLGVARSLLIRRPLSAFITPEARARFRVFLAQVFAGQGRQVCEVTLLRTGGRPCWANLHASLSPVVSGAAKWCRVAVSDLTALKRAEEAQRRLEALAAVNRELREEIIRRQAVELSLKESEQDQSRLLQQSHRMQEQLRRLSRQMLRAQEEERKRISRELHDVIAQTLTGINIRLANLKREAGLNPRSFERNVARTQKLVEKSVEIVHRFARELRPAVLDDLGLIPALLAYMKSFATRTGVRARLTAFAGVEKLDAAARTVLFRVAQEALTNVARHARASEVEVGIARARQRVCLTIKDNGQAFDVERALHAPGRNRLGLLGMRERLEMLNGSFTVLSVTGQGTTILAELPLGKLRAPRTGSAERKSL